MTRKALLLSLALPLALAGCKGSDKPAQDAKAMGEVLPGSASDAMIPYDTLRSQPPLAPPTESGTPGARKGQAAADEAPAEPAADEVEEAPAIAVPAPTASAVPEQ